MGEAYHIADKQTTDRPVVASSNCDVVEDRSSDRPQMTSKAVATVFCRMPSQSLQVPAITRFTSFTSRDRAYYNSRRLFGFVCDVISRYSTY